MGKQEEFPIPLLEELAQKCAVESRHSDLSEEKILYGNAFTTLRRVAALLRANRPIPALDLFGPPVDLIQTELENNGLTDSFGDYTIYKDVVFVANIYVLQNPLAFIRFLRVPMPDHESELSQGLITRSFNPRRPELEFGNE